MPSPIQTYLADLHGRLAGMNDGALASYIPELTKADPSAFGICLVTLDGVAYAVGDADSVFEDQRVVDAYLGVADVD